MLKSWQRDSIQVIAEISKPHRNYSSLVLWEHQFVENWMKNVFRNKQNLKDEKCMSYLELSVGKKWEFW